MQIAATLDAASTVLEPQVAAIDATAICINALTVKIRAAEDAL